jgi:hypothetical protein
MTAAPQIGFDRFIELDWAATAMRVRGRICEMQELVDLIDATHSGVAAKKKTRTVLNRLWLEPRPDLVSFAERGIDLYRDEPNVPVSALCWGMAIAAYPFFGRVAEIVGRLTALQGDCGSAEVHRRMAEVYGQREGTLRMTNMVLQTQASWGAIERTDRGKRLVRKSKQVLNNAKAGVWLVEASVRYSRKPLAVASIDTLPIIYPFHLGHSLAYSLSKSCALDLIYDTMTDQKVSLKGIM